MARFAVVYAGELRFSGLILLHFERMRPLAALVSFFSGEPCSDLYLIHVGPYFYLALP